MHSHVKLPNPPDRSGRWAHGLNNTDSTMMVQSDKKDKGNVHERLMMVCGRPECLLTRLDTNVTSESWF